MHELVLQVLSARRHVRLSCKPGQPVFKHKDPQRVNASDQHIDPHIELQALNKERLMQVSLDHVLLTFQL